MSEELPQVVLATSEKILRRSIGSDFESEIESDFWTQSGTISGSRIINTWQIYPGIWLVLSKTESGHYLISRSSDGMKTYAVVHDHNSEIFSIFYIDDGHALFCATDGWWETSDSGLSWSAIVYLSPPAARSAAIIPKATGTWQILAYAQDHKIYSVEYPGDEWSEVLDTTAIWSDKWFPTIAGGSVGVLAGAGGKLLRSTSLGAAESWSEIQDLSSIGVIKNIVISSRSNTPTFLIVVEQQGSDIDRLYRTNDLGDSLTPDLSRVGAIAAVQSVVPTGTNTPQTMFAVIGKRTAKSQKVYKILQD